MRNNPDASNTSAPRGRSPLAFFLLVYALTVPFLLFSALTGLQLQPDLPVSAFAFVCPATAAAILVYRQNGTAGVGALLGRSFDFKRIRSKVWYAPTVLLMPGIYGLTYGVMRVLGLPLPTLRVPTLAALALLLAFFVGALGEELGWSGYAIDPLQARWGALRASIILGSVWAVWHFVPLAQVHRSPGWIAWWSLLTVAQRVLMTWLYNNTGRSVFAATVFHATDDLSTVGPFLDFGPGGYPYDAELIASLLVAVAAAVVTAVWEPRTLARRRHA